MRNLNHKLFVWLLVGISVAVWVTLALICSVSSTDLFGLLKLLPTVVTIDCIVVGLFVKWIWKWNLLYPWLVPFPNLSGRWAGEIRSGYKEPDSPEKIGPIQTTLLVRQTFADISCVMETGEMRSSSTFCAFDLNPERQQRQFGYIYCSRPNLSIAERSAMHDGAIVFDIR